MTCSHSTSPLSHTYYHACAAIRFDFGRAVISSNVIVNILGPSVPSPRLKEKKNEGNALQRGKKKQGWESVNGGRHLYGIVFFSINDTRPRIEPKTT